jgi:hypothetical protein
VTYGGRDGGSPGHERREGREMLDFIAEICASLFRRGVMNQFMNNA